jgi:hypothetical protein
MYIQLDIKVKHLNINVTVQNNRDKIEIQQVRT